MLTTATLVCTYLLSDPRSLIVGVAGSFGFSSQASRADCNKEWQWDQLRIMKVGGNESATKYFQSHGGSAALASKDPKVKYGSSAATKYKEELKKRAIDDSKL